MKIYDLTLTLKDEMPTYPGDPGFQRRVVSSLEAGGSSEVSVIEMGSHTGTHIDLPAHMVKGGKRLTDIATEIFIGPARVVDMRGASGHIEADSLKELDLKDVRRVLFRTKNSSRFASATSFDKDAVALTGPAAEYLAGLRIKLVGIDGLSIDRYKSGTHPAHLPLLRAGIIILEGLNLDGVPAGDYQLICAPLKVANAEGAPARVFLVEPFLS